MSANIQTYTALAVVLLTTLCLLWNFFLKRKSPGCGGNCGAVSPEIKKLQAKLKR